MANPIWKDYYVNLGNSDSAQFRILVGDDVIYTGKAYKRPGQESIQIRINDICADFLQYVFPALVNVEFSANEYVNFRIQVETTSGQWGTIDSVQFENDWSYDHEYDPAEDGMSFPVNGHIDKRQWVIFTAYKASTITANVKLSDGTSFDVIIPVEIGDDFNADYNNDFSQSVRASQTGTALFNISQWGDVKSVTIENREFKVVNACGRYALYYINAHGGWDSLLIEGNHSEVDNLTRYMRETEYDNRSVQNRGTHNYVNEIAKTLTLHTSWLSDAESSRMHHLLNSNNVYLEDLETGEMIPVILDNTTTEYKTYKGNGGRLVNYAINVSLANNMVRR